MSFATSSIQHKVDDTINVIFGVKDAGRLLHVSFVEPTADTY